MKNANKFTDNAPNVEQFLQDPIFLATGCSWRRFLTQSGKSVCEPTNHPTDNHPDLTGDSELLSLMAASPQLLESTRMLLSALKSSLKGNTIKNADEIILFAENAIQQAASKE